MNQLVSSYCSYSLREPCTERNTTNFKSTKTTYALVGVKILGIAASYVVNMPCRVTMVHFGFILEEELVEVILFIRLVVKDFLPTISVEHKEIDLDVTQKG